MITSQMLVFLFGVFFLVGLSAIVMYAFVKFDQFPQAAPVIGVLGLIGLGAFFSYFMP